MASNSNTGHETKGGFNPVRDIGVVVSFMTRLPVGVSAHSAQSLSGAAWAFPVAGLIVGGMGGGILYGFDHMGWNPALAVLVALALMVLVTGALHEDGLADVADGFGGGATQARKLEIMRDSRIGTYGVLALIFAMALRALMLFELQQVSAGAAAILAASVFSRAVLPGPMYALPPARPDGLSAMAGRPGAVAVILSFLLGGGFVVAVFADTLVSALVAMMASVFGMVAVALLARVKIGGQTGDVLGATQQVAEIAFLMALVMFLGMRL